MIDNNIHAILLSPFYVRSETAESPPTPTKPVVQVSHGALTKRRFVCSQCGTILTRIMKEEDIAEQHDIAFFCRQNCAKQNRLGGLGRLTSVNCSEIQILSNGPMSSTEIAMTLRLSPLAVDAFLRDKVSSEGTFSITSRRPALSKKRPRYKIEEEDDIFAGISRNALLSEDD